MASSNLFFACSIQRSLRTVVPNENQLALNSPTLLDFSTDYLRSSLAEHCEFHDVEDQWLNLNKPLKNQSWELRDFAELGTELSDSDDSDVST